ncbi:hypothetical protein E2C01_016079 [Portunus trituberculatus]|uniref:Uncharacterized protein n=1 Tax=Portunus trituberculatus TaxID=210409 RepID=A0A5B7DN46_PORTR|nr:hypothetical protein [Portunus trituberculatus]
MSRCHECHPPRKKQSASAVVESSMEGATLPTTRPTCSSTLSPSFRGSRCHNIPALGYLEEGHPNREADDEACPQQQEQIGMLGHHCKDNTLHFSTFWEQQGCD